MGSNPGVLQKFCLNFHKMNRCHYILEAFVIISLFPNVMTENVPFKFNQKKTLINNNF